MRVAEVNPTIKTVLDDEVSGERIGASTEAGRRRTHLAQSLGQLLPRVTDVDTIHQDRRNHRQPLNGLRPDDRDPAHPIDGIFDRLGNQDFDLLGREARRLGLNGHLRWGELGKDIKLGACKDAGSVGKESRGQPDHDARATDRKADDPRQHGRFIRRPLRPPRCVPGTPPRAVARAPRMTTRSPGIEALGYPPSTRKRMICRYSYPDEAPRSPLDICPRERLPLHHRRAGDFNAAGRCAGIRKEGNQGRTRPQQSRPVRR